MFNIFNLFSRYLITPSLEIKNNTFSFSYLKDFEKFQYLSAEEIVARQFIKLQHITNYAYQFCPYYNEKFKLLAIHPNEIRSYNDFLKIPFLHKSDIQENIESMRSTEYLINDLYKNKTGGSTGEPVHFYIDKERHKSRYASTIRHDRWAGKDIGTYTANIWGHPGDIGSPIKNVLKLINDKYVYRVNFLDTSSLTDQKIEDYLSSLIKEKPEVFVAYSNSIYLVAKYIKIKRIQKYHKPKSIICTAEFLEDSRRELIEEVFECSVFDRYGCRETSVIASECSEHAGLHINADTLYVEILNNGIPVGPGESGEVVITDLMNKGMPLIRYRIRDVASPIEGTCNCGRGLPRIKMVGGRVTDFIVTPEGKIISGASLTIFLVANTPGVKKIQIIQDDKYHIKLKVVKNTDFNDKSIKYLTDTTIKYVGFSIYLEIEIVEDIPLAASGKNIFCKSSVNPFEITNH